jgi:hypothetical protein
MLVQYSRFVTTYLSKTQPKLRLALIEIYRFVHFKLCYGNTNLLSRYIGYCMVGRELPHSIYVADLNVRSHSHDSSFMHSDVLPFYTYTVVAELYFVVVTVSLVNLFMP